ncbi:MAG: aminopeptidase [Deltaproteobacteria bacterium]|nr:aminopeptidase [Deltaproteobacteria bacterium]
MSEADRCEMERAVRSLIEINLGVREDETLLLLGDRGDDVMDPRLPLDVAECLERIHPASRTVIYPSTGRSGIEPPESVWEAAFGLETVRRFREGGLFKKLLEKNVSEQDIRDAGELVSPSDAVDTVVALAFHSTSHTSFRKMLTLWGKARYASMPHFLRDMFFGSMNVDWRALASSTQTLARALEGVDAFEIRAGNGTDLRLEVSGRPFKADDGDLTKPGSFGNLPAGEVFMAPLEGTTEGTLVIEWGPSSKLAAPLKVNIEEGRAVSVSGGNPDDVKWLEGLFSAHPENNNIAELGIGTNPGATRPDSILESEKILGTVHLAFGDNHTFGGNVVAPFHLDFVVYNATLEGRWELGGGRRVLLTEGKPGW